ncbi:hypothetical protein [Streptomyces specialis]|uniref:hypothetical protein n=1 Tax=Streptomyces specialis TaxID=498367 RepID=UPI001F454E13|nr:hypothetical protein [Streptomyces specialis]
MCIRADHRTARTVLGAIGGGSLELPPSPQYQRILARPDAGGAMEYLCRLLRIQAGDILAYNDRRYRDDEPYDGLVQLAAHGVAEIGDHTVHQHWWGTAHVWRTAATPYHAAAARAIGCFIDASPLPGATRRLPGEATGRYLALLGFGGPPAADPMAVGCVTHPALARACATLDVIAEGGLPADVVARQHLGPLFHAASARMPVAARLNEGAVRLLDTVTGGLLAEPRAPGRPSVSPFDRPGVPAVAYELPAAEWAAALAAQSPEQVEKALVDASPVPLPAEPPGLPTPRPLYTSDAPDEDASGRRSRAPHTQPDPPSWFGATQG